MKHLSAGELSALADGALSGRARERADEHLRECAACRTGLAAVERQDAMLAGSLGHDPGDAYFERFADRVAERIERAAPSPAPPPDRVRRPRTLALAGGLAALLAGAGLVLVVARESRIPDLRDPDIAAQSQPRPASPETQPPRPTESREEGATATPGTDDRARAAGPAAETSAGSSFRPASPGAASGTVGSTRMTRMQRTPGEDLPAGTRRDAVNAPPAASAPPPSAAEITPQAIKPRSAPLEGAADRAETMAKRSEQESQALRSPAPESAAPTYEYSQPAANELCGTVRDQDGRPVAGAQVVVADAGTSAVTAADGGYCVRAPAGEHTISVLAVGYTPWRRTVRFGETASLDVAVRSIAVLQSPLATGRALEEATDAFTRSNVRGAPSTTDLRAAAVDPFAALPDRQRTQARQALALGRDAERERSVARYDQAARLWERLLPSLRPGTAETEALRALSDVRFRAWELSRTETRRVAAARALDRYIERAPEGIARTLAERRRASLAAR